MNPHRTHAAVEIVDHFGKAAENVGTAKDTARVAKAISGTEAFRKYNWLKGVPTRNISGNFRGMVVSARWRAIFDFSEKYIQKTEKVSAVAEKIVLVAGMAVNLAKAAPQIERILDSNDAWSTKVARLGPQVTSVVSRTLYEVVAGPARLLANSIIVKGYCDMGDLIRGQSVGSCQQTLKQTIGKVDTEISNYTDGENLYLLINTRVNPAVSDLLGL